MARSVARSEDRARGLPPSPTIYLPSPAFAAYELHAMPNLVADLTALLDPARVLHSREHLLAYGYDGTAALSGVPAVVVMVKTTDEIAGIVKYAAANRIAIVGRGSGTGLSGGSVPSPGCIVLCTAQMDRVLELDEKNLTILVESGVITQKVTDMADSVGLLYPPDPGSMKISTIGGNVAENSGGLREIGRAHV